MEEEEDDVDLIKSDDMGGRGFDRRGSFLFVVRDFLELRRWSRELSEDSGSLIAAEPFSVVVLNVKNSIFVSYENPLRSLYLI